MTTHPPTPRPIRRATLALALALLALTAPTAADEASGPEAAAPAEPAPEDPRLAKARELFKEGVEAVRAAQWSNALVAFEGSAELRSHATTTFNIGAVERAMGRYSKARETFHRALQRGREHPGELAPSLEQEARGFVDEIDRLLARVTLVLDPPGAAIAVDGRPLAERRGSAGSTTYVAGVEDPGPGRPVSLGTFEVLVNPGAHVITLSRKGYTDVVLNRTFTPGSVTKLPLALERLPATIDISSNIDGAIVSVNGKDFGPAPVNVLRPAGSYSVSVTKDGFEPYETEVVVQPGERNALRATLMREETPITKRWWFWTAAAAIVVGGVVTTYMLTRPDPQPPPYNGGSTGWVVEPAAVEF